jgi:hypothetical protein
MEKGSLKEVDDVVDESMWADWQNAKAKGLKDAQNFIQRPWAIENGFGFIFASQNLLNKILKGEFRQFNEITLFQQYETKNNEFYSSIHYYVFYYTHFDNDVKKDITIIDSIFNL